MGLIAKSPVTHHMLWETSLKFFKERKKKALKNKKMK